MLLHLLCDRLSSHRCCRVLRSHARVEGGARHPSRNLHHRSDELSGRGGVELGLRCRLLGLLSRLLGCTSLEGLLDLQLVLLLLLLLT